jgi:hypothetical protein
VELVTTNKAKLTVEYVNKEDKRYIERIFSRDQYGKDGKLYDTDAYMFKILAFINTPPSGLLDINISSWFIKEKINMLNESGRLSSEILELEEKIKSLGIPLGGIEYTTDINDENKVKLVFKFNATEYVMDPMIMNMGDFTNGIAKIKK